MLIKDIPFRIPDEWNASWYRQHFVEVIAKGDYHTSGFLTLADVVTVVDGRIASHNADPFAHGSAFNAHRAEVDPHPQYVTEAPLDGNNYVRNNGEWVVVAGGSPDTEAMLDDSGDGYIWNDGTAILWNS